MAWCGRTGLRRRCCGRLDQRAGRRVGNRLRAQRHHATAACAGGRQPARPGLRRRAQQQHVAAAIELRRRLQFADQEGAAVIAAQAGDRTHRKPGREAPAQSGVRYSPCFTSVFNAHPRVPGGRRGRTRSGARRARHTTGTHGRIGQQQHRGMARRGLDDLPTARVIDHRLAHVTPSRLPASTPALAHGSRSMSRIGASCTSSRDLPSPHSARNCALSRPRSQPVRRALAISTHCADCGFRRQLDAGAGVFLHACANRPAIRPATTLVG